MTVPYISTRDGRAARASAFRGRRCCTGLRMMAGSMCPNTGRTSRRGGLAALARQDLCRDRRRGDRAVPRGRGRRRRSGAASSSEAYRGFDHRAVAPLKQLGPGLWLMELFHGPTLAFKDYALQLLGPLFDARAQAARRAGHGRRRDLGRYRLGRDRGLPRPRRDRHLHPLSRRAASPRCSAAR